MSDGAAKTAFIRDMEVSLADARQQAETFTTERDEARRVLLETQAQSERWVSENRRLKNDNEQLEKDVAALRKQLEKARHELAIEKKNASKAVAKANRSEKGLVALHSNMAQLLSSSTFELKMLQKDS
ncbi:hypothetical protein MVEN_02598800 [Mycena venus]|nr:hypothetical protein MVEN_02598800 [Mycena venus]